MLFRDSSEDFIGCIKDIECRADQCLEHFKLLKAPLHVAHWTILSATVHIVEEHYHRFSPDSAAFRAAMINVARHAPMLIRWLGRGRTASVPSDWVPRWESFVGAQAFGDLSVVAAYDAFQITYPMWYRDRLSAELVSTDTVHFDALGGARDRQVTAFQMNLRRRSGLHKAISTGRVEPTESILRQYHRILEAASPQGALGFRYELSDELAIRTFRKYRQRSEHIMRRRDDLELGEYTLGEFKNIYAAMQSLCAIHDFLCFRWGQRTGTYPIESAVLVKTRKEWIRLLSRYSGIGAAPTEQLLSDLTFYSKRLPDLHVFPLVPLDEKRELLALAPPFILGSAPEDNILRTCSYLRESAYNLLSNDKAAVMRDDLLKNLKRFRCKHSIRLPDGSTDIDLLVEDHESSTVVIAELKWIRRPSTYRERLRADEEFEDGYKRQLATIRAYCRDHPSWLKDRQSLTCSISDYDNVFYLLIGRGHWSWFEPQDSAAAVEFEQFRLAMERHNGLNEAVCDLLKYDWLPIEGEDFHVQFERRIVESVGVESAVYYGCPPEQSQN